MVMTLGMPTKNNNIVQVHIKDRYNTCSVYLESLKIYKNMFLCLIWVRLKVK